MGFFDCIVFFKIHWELVCESQWTTLPKPAISIFSQFLNSINDLRKWLEAEDYLNWSTH
jgi:hypothetical protein